MSILKFKLTLAFDGTGYHGWQGQRSGRGVQDQLQAAVARLFKNPSPLVSSSRTDTGVHARALVTHFELPGQELGMPPRQLVLAINALLPDDIRVRSAVRVPMAFDARFDAVAKQYRYFLWNHPAMDPLRRGQAWHVPRALDLAAMREAAGNFVGTHDFSAFTAKRPGVLGDPVRTLTRCEIRRRGPDLTFVIEAGGFLYKMCRGIAGTLVQVGEGRFPPDEIKTMLASADRRAAGVNAPAHGLVLWQVRYPRR